MQITPLTRREAGSILLACFVLTVCIIILGVMVWITILVCPNLPSGPGRAGDTNVQLTVTVPAAGKSDQAWRLVLQRTTNGTDWEDLAGANWNGSMTRFGVTTNWSTMGLFRIKALPTK